MCVCVCVWVCAGPVREAETNPPAPRTSTPSPKQLHTWSSELTVSRLPRPSPVHGPSTGGGGGGVINHRLPHIFICGVRHKHGFLLCSAVPPLASLSLLSGEGTILRGPPRPPAAPTVKGLVGGNWKIWVEVRVYVCSPEVSDIVYSQGFPYFKIGRASCRERVSSPV